MRYETLIMDRRAADDTAGSFVRTEMVVSVIIGLVMGGLVWTVVKKHHDQFPVYHTVARGVATSSKAHGIAHAPGKESHAHPASFAAMEAPRGRGRPLPGSPQRGAAHGAPARVGTASAMEWWWLALGSCVAATLGIARHVTRRSPGTRPHSESCSAAPTPPPSALGLPRRQAVLSAVGLGAGLSTAFTAAPALAADEAAVRSAVREAFARSIPSARYPAVLRLVFHDAGTYDVRTGTGGANASVQFELDRPESRGLKRGLRPVQEAQQLLQGGPAAALSFADLICLAGAYVVEAAGGPSITVPLGRVDAAAADPPGRIPEETLSGPELRAHFAKSGFTTQEFVALCGAHTLGSKGFGDPVTFDNTYYKTLLEKPWAAPNMTAEQKAMTSHIGLPSDKALPEDAECLPYIKLYAQDSRRFYHDFAEAYKKLSVAGTGLVA